MHAGRPSRTAWGAAVHRAVHQVRDGARVFRNPLAVPILGADGDAAIRGAPDNPAARRLRLFIVAQSAFADTALAAAAVDQLVVLGAGLDTTAYRARDALRSFEVDHPATQTWKRELLAAAHIAIPSSLAFVPIDFERDALLDALSAAGFDRARPSLISWLGVVPYLTTAAIDATLAALATLPRTHLVFDYANPRDEAAHAALAARVARAGESFKSYFETAAMHATLACHGFRVVDDLGPTQLAARYTRHASSRERGGHIIHAAR